MILLASSDLSLIKDNINFNLIHPFYSNDVFIKYSNDVFIKYFILFKFHLDFILQVI